MSLARVIAGVSALGLLACGAPAGPGADLRGRWRYDGVQVEPLVTLQGTLTITTQSGGTVRGTLEVEERDRLGGVLGRTGLVTGRVSGTGVDLDVVLGGGVSRRHLGAVEGDSIAGAWVQGDGSAGAVAGNFSMRRDPEAPW